MTELSTKVYTLLKQVPPGRVTTYKLLAQAAGTRAYRAIGQMMRHNPFAPDVPCHRVVSSNGLIGGFRGVTRGSDIEDKVLLLSQEGVRVVDNRVVDFESRLFRFSE